MSLIADRIQNLGTENAFKFGDNIRKCAENGMEIIRFNIGEPDFDTPDFICDEAIRQLKAKNTSYTPPPGVQSFREAIANYLTKTREIAIDPNRIIVTPGAKLPISYSLLTYTNPGDEVIYPSPGYPVFESWITFTKAKPVPLHLKESKGFRFNAEDLEKLITPKTKLIFLNSPSNPTGGVLSKEDLASIAKVIREKGSKDLRIYSDEIYEQIVYDGLKHRSIISEPGMKERTILVSGHSKGFAMTGWRVGFAVLPTEQEMEIFKNLNINYIACLPGFVQEGAREAYENPQSKDIVAKMVASFEERRNYTVPALNAIPGVTCAKPNGAFYVFPNVEKVCAELGILDLHSSMPNKEKTNPSKILQMFLLYKHGLAVMDRKSFGRIEADGEHFIRLSTATSLELLKVGIEKLAHAFKDKDGFTKFFKDGKNLY